ncbi:MAG: hypothetical protein HPY78_03340 [Brevinematales bacterium]|nr:hypothetical protein [Brevinematales bacterium]
MNSGTDVRLDNWDVIIAPWGDLLTVSGDECFLQGLKHRLETPLGSYFYAPSFGSRLWEFLHTPATPQTLLAYEIALRDALEMDPLIILDSLEIETSFEKDTLVARVKFSTVEDSLYNLVVKTGKEISLMEDTHAL